MNRICSQINYFTFIIASTTNEAHDGRPRPRDSDDSRSQLPTAAQLYQRWDAVATRIATIVALSVHHFIHSHLNLAPMTRPSAGAVSSTSVRLLLLLHDDSSSDGPR
eukprot:scaffold108940_cov62-Attheya_sp.AAC.1